MLFYSESLYFLLLSGFTWYKLYTHFWCRELQVNSVINFWNRCSQHLLAAHFDALMLLLIKSPTDAHSGPNLNRSLNNMKNKAGFALFLDGLNDRLIEFFLSFSVKLVFMWDLRTLLNLPTQKQRLVLFSPLCSPKKKGNGTKIWGFNLCF